MEGVTVVWLVLGAGVIAAYYLIPFPHLFGDPWGAYGQRVGWWNWHMTAHVGLLAATLLPTWDAFLRHDAEWAHERDRTATAVVLTLVCLALALGQYAWHVRLGRPLVWLPFLVPVTIYNAWGASQYTVQGAQRAVAYQFVTLATVWASLQLHEPDLGTPTAPRRGALPSAREAVLYLATYDLPVCLYVFQLLTLVVRLAARHDDPEGRWNDLPAWAPAPALGVLGLKALRTGLLTGSYLPVRTRVPAGPPAPVTAARARKEDRPLLSLRLA